MNFFFIPRIFGGAIKRQPGIQTGQPLVTFRGKRQKVTEDTAMQISAVWAAVNLKATTLASMALKFYNMTGNGREENTEHPLARLFSYKPNQYQTRTEFFETLGLNLYLTGNAYSIIQRDNTGRIIGLLPAMASQVEPELLVDGSVIYKYNDGRNVTVYSSENVWHVMLMGNGVKGLSPLEYAANAIGMAISGEEWSSNVIGNGGKPTGVLTYDKTLTKEQRDILKDKFRDLREGPTDALMVLEAGMQYQQISLSPQDVQLLEARRFQINDIARFFNVPSVMINDTSGSTVWGSGIEQIITGWYKLGLRPELERIESSIKCHLMGRAESERMSVHFDFEELLRTDFKTRVDTGSRAVGAGLMTRNEWRQREWLPEIQGADKLTAQINLTEIDALPRAADDGN